MFILTGYIIILCVLLLQYSLVVHTLAFYDALTFALDFKTSAKFLLVIEKDASFQHVVGSNFIETTGPCIVATVSLNAALKIKCKFFFAR